MSASNLSLGAAAAEEAAAMVAPLICGRARTHPQARRACEMGEVETLGYCDTPGGGASLWLGTTEKATRAGRASPVVIIAIITIGAIAIAHARTVEGRISLGTWDLAQPDERVLEVGTSTGTQPRRRWSRATPASAVVFPT